MLIGRMNARSAALPTGGPLGDPIADRVRQRELAAQAMALAGADAEVGADDGHPIAVGHGDYASCVPFDDVPVSG